MRCRHVLNTACASAHRQADYAFPFDDGRIVQVLLFRASRANAPHSTGRVASFIAKHCLGRHGGRIYTRLPYGDVDIYTKPAPSVGLELPIHRYMNTIYAGCILLRSKA